MLPICGANLGDVWDDAADGVELLIEPPAPVPLLDNVLARPGGPRRRRGPRAGGAIRRAGGVVVAGGVEAGERVLGRQVRAATISQANPTFARQRQTSSAMQWFEFDARLRSRVVVIS